MVDVWLVDAFTDHVFSGNGCGVIFDADALSAGEKQSIARELNQSESIFFSSPTDRKADYYIRIFTPTQEIPFAGHPTLTAAHVYLEKFAGSARPTSLVQQCGVGLIPIEINYDGHLPRITMVQQTPTIFNLTPQPEAVADLFHQSSDELKNCIPPLLVNTGIDWAVVEVPETWITGAVSLAAVMELCAIWNNNDIAVFAKTSQDPALIKVRAFAPLHNIIEDPVTGSAQGCIAAALCHSGFWGTKSEVSYQASQGAEIGREGKVFIRIDSANTDAPVIRVGGHAVTTLRGSVNTLLIKR